MGVEDIRQDVHLFSCPLDGEDQESQTPPG